MDPDHELLAARRAEAIALFEANQRARAWGAGLLVLVVIGCAVASGAAVAGDVELAAVLAPALLLLLAFAFQVFADVSVTGAARAALEDLIAAQLEGRHALIYEHAVAGIRKRPPLVASVRVLQLVTMLAVLATVGVGFAGAFGEGTTWLARAAFCVAVTAGALAAALAFRAMRQSGGQAREDIAALDVITERD